MNNAYSSYTYIIYNSYIYVHEVAVCFKKTHITLDMPKFSVLKINVQS